MELTHRDAHCNALAIYQGRPLLAELRPLHSLERQCEHTGEMTRERIVAYGELRRDHEYFKSTLQEAI